MINNQEDFAKRNKKSNLVGTVKCPICLKKFEFETNVNSNEIVTDVITSNPIGISPHSNSLNYRIIISELVSTCPNCNCKFKYYVKEKIQR